MKVKLLQDQNYLFNGVTNLGKKDEVVNIDDNFYDFIKDRCSLDLGEPKKEEPKKEEQNGQSVVQQTKEPKTNKKNKK